MKPIVSQIDDFQELSASEMKELNGGYGSYPGYDYKTATAIGETFWGGVSSFIDGFKEGYQQATRNGGRL